MSIVIPPFDYDDCFLPLSSGEDVENARLTMTKAEFKEWTVKENKKGQFNQKLSDYAVMRESKRKLLQSHNREIEVLSDVITEFKNKQLTLTGTVKEIQKQITDFNHQISEFQNSRAMSEDEKVNVYRDFVKANKEFDRITCIVGMELDVYRDKDDRKKQEKQDATDPLWKNFLKRLNALPDDILRVVRGYFTYETRAALLTKYRPIKLYQSLNKNLLKTAIYRIYRKYHTRCNNPELKKEMNDLWAHFYKDYHISEYTYHSASVKDMKLMIEYLFYLFHKYQRPRCYFELYRSIVVMKYVKA